MNERKQIEKAKSNLDEFSPLYEKYYQQILNYVYAKTAHLEDAQEVTSEVFVKAMVNLSTYQDRGIPFAAWLYRIAFNECMLYFRKTSKMQQVIIDDKILERMQEMVDDWDKEHLYEVLSHVIQKLNPKEVELLELRYFSEMPYREIACVLNISESNAKVRMFRLLSKVRVAVREKTVSHEKISG